MARLTWMDGTVENGNNVAGLEQVLRLAEEMFDRLADRLQRKTKEQHSQN